MNLKIKDFLFTEQSKIVGVQEMQSISKDIENIGDFQ
jgi:hypothetical protein